MPHSFHTRRGKPRIETQQEHALVSTRTNRNLPYHKRSKIGRIKPNFSKDGINNNNEYNQSQRNNDNIISQEETKKKMWKYNAVSAENPISAPVMSSSFATRYPEHREPYIRKTFDKMEKFFKKYGINIQVFYHQCSMVVSTTNKTWDPYSIIKARDLIKLISRYVPFEHASKVMEDNVFSDIIEVGKTNVARNQVRFIKRRARLIGPNGMNFISMLTLVLFTVFSQQKQY